ncbi:MAG: hypothetical protein ABI333_30300 [bacterium]
MIWACVAALCAAALALATGCKDEAVCGDGVIEGNEECDQTELGGATCGDALPGTTGTLACSGECTFDTTGCSCGDSLKQFGEDCDCGSDPQNLPPGCTDVNGGANANCDSSCLYIDLCGDGIRTGDEECDCGDSAMLTAPAAGCTVYNGGPGATCDESCLSITQCQYDLYDECFPLEGETPTNGCCEDDYGVQLECKSSLFGGMDNMCARDCATSDECPWNNFCWGTVNLCHYSMCGPGNAVDAPFHGACQAPGATAGLCIPFGRYVDTHGFYGFCLEQGQIPHGDPCPTGNAGPPVYLLGTDRDIAGGAAASLCDTGLCLATTGATEGICARFCDWQAEYDAIFYGGTQGPLTCPASSNCWAETTISLNDVTANPDYGYRGADLAYCRPTEAADPTYGLTTCSLVTSQLLSNPSLTCADTNADGRCKVVTFGMDYDNDGVDDASEPTLGSLIGVCDDSLPATVANVWAECDAANDVCPPGSGCIEQDVFGAATAATRCIPYCDTSHHDGVTATCADLGTPATTTDGTPTCTSISYTFGAGGEADTSKSRLGYCALPRP